MNFINYNTSNIKLFILIIFFSFILYYLLKCTETFINEEPFKIVFDDTPNPLILNEGVYSITGTNKIPNLISQKINNIVSFSIDPSYYALISLNNTEPKIFRGEYIIQNDNIFKNITSLKIVKNI
jgi:hypothetical protein